MRCVPWITKIFLFIIIAAASLIISGCDDFSFYSVLDGSSPDTPKTFSLPDQMSVTVNSTTRIPATGGNPPYIYYLAEGVGVIDNLNGEYTALSVVGYAKITVTDQDGTELEMLIIITE